MPELLTITARSSLRPSVSVTVSDTAVGADSVAVTTGPSALLATAAELASLPTSGTAWTYLTNRDAQIDNYPGTQTAGTNKPDLQMQDSFTQTNAICSALIYARAPSTTWSGAGTRLSTLQSMLKALPGSEVRATDTDSVSVQGLNVFRQIAGWLIVADLIDFDSTTICPGFGSRYTGLAGGGVQWGDWLTGSNTVDNGTSILDRNVSVNGSNSNWDTIHKCARDAGNNWGFYARSAWTAVAITLSLSTELAEVTRLTRRLLGDTSYTGADNPFSTTSDYREVINGRVAGDSWSIGGGFPASQGVFNPSTGDTRDGVNVEDVCRGGSTSDITQAYVNATTLDPSTPTLANWDGHSKALTYFLETQDALCTTLIMLWHAGNTSCWGWSSSAASRNMDFAYNHGATTTNAFGLYQQLPHLHNYVYGSSYTTANLSGNVGRALTATSWLTTAGSSWLT